MADLPTNYLDDILAQSMNGKRKYRITRADGTFEEVTLEDVSEYEQVGSNFGAGDINKTNQAVNEKFDSGDVVDPMLTTEPGFAADAYQTKLQFDEQNKNLDDLLKWKTYGTQILTGDNFINLSDLENAKEVLFQIPINNSYDVYVDILVPIDVLKSTSVTYRRAGYFFNSSGYLLAQVQAGNMLARTEVYVNGAGMDGFKVNILYR